MRLVIGIIFVIFGGVVFAFGIGTANLAYYLIGAIAAAIGFYAYKGRKV